MIEVAGINDELCVESPGQTLRQAREQANLTVREVAAQLHLLPNQVEYLEADEYHRFSGDIFCKGYLKSYGQLLGLDPTPLIEAYMQIRPEPEKQYKAVAKPAAHIQKPGKGHSIQYWCLAVFIIVIGVLWHSFDGENKPVAKAPLLDSPVVIDKQIDSPRIELVTGIDLQDSFAGDITSSEADASPVELMATGFAAEAVEASGELAPENMLLKDSDSAASNTPVTDSQIVSTAAVSASNAKPSVTVSEEDVLTFSFNRDCWVEVADGSDEQIFADLKRSGDTLELSGRPPFTVLLGYAPGVSLIHNGDPVAIEVNRSDNRAHFMVGETVGE